MTEDERKMVDRHQRRIAELEDELRMAIKTIQRQRNELTSERARVFADLCCGELGSFASNL